jgi:hypothetical protein
MNTINVIGTWTRRSANIAGHGLEAMLPESLCVTRKGVWYLFLWIKRTRLQIIALNHTVAFHAFQKTIFEIECSVLWLVPCYS